MNGKQIHAIPTEETDVWIKFGTVPRLDGNFKCRPFKISGWLDLCKDVDLTYLKPTLQLDENLDLYCQGHTLRIGKATGYSLKVDGGLDVTDTFSLSGTLTLDGNAWLRLPADPSKLNINKFALSGNGRAKIAIEGVRAHAKGEVRTVLTTAGRLQPYPRRRPVRRRRGVLQGRQEPEGARRQG